MRRAGGQAFTLLELLVVISLITLLLAILLPVMGRSRDAAGAAVCGSNLRQIAGAFHLYAADYDGWVPHYFNGDSTQAAAVGDLVGNANWNERLMKTPGPSKSKFYLPFDSSRKYESVWYCPLTTRQLQPRGGDTSTQYSINYFIYGERHGNGTWAFGRKPAKLDRLRPGTYLVSDGAFNNNAVSRSYQDFFNEKCGTVGGDNEPWMFDPVTQKAGAHQGAANVALVDTSIERVNRWEPAAILPRLKGAF